MERFSYKGGCGVHGCTRIETFKELGWAIDKQFRLITNKMSVIPLNLKNKAIFNFCMHCYVTLSNVF